MDARAAAATKIVRMIIFQPHAGVSNNTKDVVAISFLKHSANPDIAPASIALLDETALHLIKIQFEST